MIIYYHYYIKIPYTALNVNTFRKESKYKTFNFRQTDNAVNADIFVQKTKNQSAFRRSSRLCLYPYPCTKKDILLIGRQSNIKTTLNPKTNWVQRHAGAGSGGRTRTVSLPLDFESSTSANSIIPAFITGILYHRP